MSVALSPKIEAPLARLQLWDCSISADLRPEALERLLTGDQAPPGVILMTGQRLVGLISRKRFFYFISRPFSRELYTRKPVSAMVEVLDPDPVILEIDAPVYAAVEAALGRGEGRGYEPLLVRTRDGGLRLVEIDVLLRAQSLELERALREKDTLIAEVRRGADELRGAQKRLVQSEKMAALGQLVAGIAHEINTPIGVALTAATHLADRTGDFEALLKSGGMKRSDLSRYIETATESSELIRFNIARAAQLIQSFKQVAVDQASEQRRSFDLGDYLGQLVTSLSPEVRRGGSKITFSCPSGIEMNSLPGALAQVLSNLITNALAHAWPPGTGGMIAVTAIEYGEDVEITVADDGIGMTPDVKARIYDPFFTTKRGAGGSGLGLHIVFNIVVETLKGTIDCVTAPGEGARFIVTIPRATKA